VNGNGSELERVATAVVGAQQVSQPVSTKSKVPSKPVGSPKLRAGKAAAPAPASVSLEAPYLHLLRVAGRGDYQTWSALLSGFDRPGVPMALVFASGIRIQHPEAPLGVGEKVLRAMAPRSAGSKARSRKQVTGTQPMSLAQQIQRFEAVLDPQPQPKGGVLSGSEFMRAQRRSLAYAALDEIGKHSLETQGATEMSRWFALGSSKRAGKRAAAFQRWYAHLAKSRVGRPELAALRADVDSAAPGPAQALRSYEALRAHVSPDDPSLREAARDLVRRMDSRPEHRVELATIAEHDLGALSIAERLETSAAAVLGTSDPSRLAWRARLRNDADTSSSDARQPPDAPGAMATATDLPDSVVGSQLARRLAAHPTAWEAAERYAAWLQERGKFASARGVLERWVSRTQGDSGSVVTSIDARTRIAHLLQLEGHPERGLQLLGELHRSGHFGAMERTALILQDLGQTNQALAIAWAAHRRAPQFAPGRALLTELFWRQGRYGEAAKVLQDGPRKLSGAAWTREIAPRYVAFFRTRESEGLQAAEALVRAGFDDRATFGAIPEALGAEGLNTLAFELQSRMPLSGAQGVESSILAYGHLKRDKGEGAAIQWIRRRVAEKDRVLLGILAHQEQHPELLWSMAPSRLQGELGDYYWLLRAAACMVAGPSHPHYAETVGHVGRARGTYRLEIAKYLLGLREESEVLVLAQTLRQRSEIYYFVGLKTERRGRLRDAADWYLMSVESGAGNNIESRWAMQRLRLWTDEGRPRDRVAPAQPPPA
jgi:tetratricopeptide (TPR) repeat protein